jgi:transketolase
MIAAEKQLLTKIAHTVRALSADAIEKQQSGHPGLPLGAAELGAFLFTKVLKYNPKNPQWMGRDRFILSAGHGSMFLYALLHLSGYDLSLDDLKNFRLLHSPTPGHPEYGDTPGVETTTGPLGQGVAVGTGMAIAQKWLAARFGDELLNSKIWILAGDGCMMEGISAESGSLAGTLALNNLVLIYDSNGICLDGPTYECMTEDIATRYKAYGFRVFEISGYDFDEMEQAFSEARSEMGKPILIIVKTIIGKHCPNRQGKNVSHGKFLGPEEMSLFKKEIGWPEDKTFYIPPDVSDYFKSLQPQFQQNEDDWNKKFKTLIKTDSEKFKLWNTFFNKTLPEDLERSIWDFDLKPDQPTRKYNEALVQILAEKIPFFLTSSADVSSVDFTWLLDRDIVSRESWSNQQIKFGVREFAMAACATGMSLFGMIQPVVGTFLVFSDYMRNAVRMSALMKQHVIYVFSHDSILIGQDGPTHQPVEHLMSLRLIPNLVLIRPGDENESKAAWLKALQEKNRPVALCFTRQPVKSSISDLTDERALKGIPRGAYVIYGNEAGSFADVEIFASGSEIHLAVYAACELQKENYSVRVVSLPSWELFDEQDEEYRKVILSGNARYQISIEAGRGLGWQKFVGRNGLIISQETYGASAPESDMAECFGFTGEKVLIKIKEFINNKLGNHVNVIEEYRTY